MRAFGVDISRGRKANAASDGSRLIGQDVAKEIVSNDDIKTTRISHHVNRCGINVAVVDANLRVFAAHFLDDAAPQAAGEDQNIVLVDQSEVVSRTGCCLFECVAHQALHAKGRVDGDLLRDLVNRALTQGSTVTGVQAFGALAHDDEINIAGVGQRGRDARVVVRGAQIHVMVQREAELKEQAALKNT